MCDAKKRACVSSGARRTCGIDGLVRERVSMLAASDSWRLQRLKLDLLRAYLDLKAEIKVS